MKIDLHLAQHYHAPIIIEPLRIKQVIELVQIIDTTNTILRVDTPVSLPTEPIIYRSPDGQCEVLNARQTIMGGNSIRLHPYSRILVSRLTAPTDLPMARLFYNILEPARLFGDIDPLIHTAYSGSHETALLCQHVLHQRPDQGITTQQLEMLCGNRVRKSTLNNRKKVLGYAQPGRGCKARESNNLSNQTRHAGAS